MVFFLEHDCVTLKSESIGETHLLSEVPEMFSLIGICVPLNF